MEELEARIKAVLDEIRPFLQAEGGGVEYLGLDGKMVKLRLIGACACCPGAMMTLKMGIESQLREKIPEIDGVIPV